MCVCMCVCVRACLITNAVGTDPVPLWQAGRNISSTFLSFFFSRPPTSFSWQTSQLTFSIILIHVWYLCELGTTESLSISCNLACQLLFGVFKAWTFSPTNTWDLENGRGGREKVLNKFIPLPAGVVHQVQLSSDLTLLPNLESGLPDGE